MYRTELPKIPEPGGRAIDRSRHSIIKVTNGITSRIAFPCYYMYREDGEPFFPHHKVPPIWQDHLGWPRPDRRDHSFQPKMVKGLIIEPIHLSLEGYDLASMFVDGAPSGLTWSASIDDFIVRVTINAMCDDADTEKVEVPFSLYLSGALDVDGVTYPARDLVTSGTLRILPAIHN